MARFFILAIKVKLSLSAQRLARLAGRVVKFAVLIQRQGFFSSKEWFFSVGGKVRDQNPLGLSFPPG